MVSTTQERELHAWDLVTLQDMRMGGYPSKVRRLSWSAAGPFLVCTGADVVTAWSFADGGPAGKPPIEIGYVYRALITAAAAHPFRALVAGGYSNGAILVGGLAKGEALVARAGAGAPTTALAWSDDGSWLLAGTEDGDGILVAVPGNLNIR